MQYTQKKKRVVPLKNINKLFGFALERQGLQLTDPQTSSSGGSPKVSSVLRLVRRELLWVNSLLYQSGALRTLNSRRLGKFVDVLASRIEMPYLVRVLYHRSAVIEFHGELPRHAFLIELKF